MLYPKIVLALIIFVLNFTTNVLAQNTIDSACIHSKIYELASPKMEGREAGTYGGDYAKDYIVSYLKSIKVNDLTHIQNVPLVHIYNGKSYFFNGKDTLKEFKDFYISQAKRTLKLNPLEIVSKTVVEVDYLSDWQNQMKKYKNKWLLFSFKDKSDKKIEELIQLKVSLQQKGVIGLMISIPIETNNSFFSDSKKTYLKEDLNYEEFPVILLNNESCKRFLKQNKKISFVHNNTQFVNGYNIYTVFPGKKSSGKTTLLSAHYDHLGYNSRGIYYGADDNASGTAALMCIANQFAVAQKTPQQNEEDVMIAWWTAEEKGLLGSRYFTKNLPIEANKIHAVINVDMIGRYDTEYNPPSNYIYVIGSNFINQKLHEANELVNSNEQNLILDYRYNSMDHPEDLFERSDQYNFHALGIPSIFFFSGFHSDYHTVYDTPDKIDAHKASKIASHIFNLSNYLSQSKNQLIR